MIYKAAWEYCKQIKKNKNIDNNWQQIHKRPKGSLIAHLSAMMIRGGFRGVWGGRETPPPRVSEKKFFLL